MSKLELEKRPEDPFFSKILLDRYIAIIRQQGKIEIFDILDFSTVSTFKITACQSQNLIEHRSQIVIQPGPGTFTLAILNPMANKVVFINGSEAKTTQTAAFQQASAVKVMDEYLLIFAKGAIRLVKIDFAQFGLRPIALNELGSSSILDIAYDKESSTFALLYRDKLQIILAKEDKLSLAKQNNLIGDTAANLWYNGLHELRANSGQSCLLISDVNKNIYYCKEQHPTNEAGISLIIRSLPGVSHEARLISPGLIITRYDQTAKVFAYDEHKRQF